MAKSPCFADVFFKRISAYIQAVPDLSQIQNTFVSQLGVGKTAALDVLISTNHELMKLPDADKEAIAKSITNSYTVTAGQIQDLNPLLKPQAEKLRDGLNRYFAEVKKDFDVRSTELTDTAKKIINNTIQKPYLQLNWSRLATAFVTLTEWWGIMKILDNANPWMLDEYLKNKDSFRNDFNASVLTNSQIDQLINMWRQWFKKYLFGNGFQNIEDFIHTAGKRWRMLNWRLWLWFRAPNQIVQRLWYELESITSRSLRGQKSNDPIRARQVLDAFGLWDIFTEEASHFFYEERMNVDAPFASKNRLISKMREFAKNPASWTLDPLADRLFKTWRETGSERLKNLSHAVRWAWHSWVINLVDNYKIAQNKIQSILDTRYNKDFVLYTDDEIMKIITDPTPSAETLRLRDKFFKQSSKVMQNLTSIWRLSYDNLTAFTNNKVRYTLRYFQPRALNMAMKRITTAILNPIEAGFQCMKNLYTGKRPAYEAPTPAPTTDVEEILKKMKSDKNLTDEQKAQIEKWLWAGAGKEPPTSWPRYQPVLDLYKDPEFLGARYTIFEALRYSHIMERELDPTYEKKSLMEKALGAFTRFTNLHIWMQWIISTVFARLYNKLSEDLRISPEMWNFLPVFVEDLAQRYQESMLRETKVITQALDVTTQIAHGNMTEDTILQYWWDAMMSVFNRSASYFSTRLGSLMYGEKWATVNPRYQLIDTLLQQQMDPNIIGIQDAQWKIDYMIKENVGSKYRIQMVMWNWLLGRWQAMFTSLTNDELLPNESYLKFKTQLAKDENINQWFLKWDFKWLINSMSVADSNDFIKKLWDTTIWLESQNREITGLTSVWWTKEWAGATYHMWMDVLNNQAIKRYSPTFADKEAQKFLIAMAQENYYDPNYRAQLFMDYQVDSPERAEHLMAYWLNSIYLQSRYWVDYKNDNVDTQLKREILEKYSSTLPISQVITNRAVELYVDKNPAYSGYKNETTNMPIYSQFKWAWTVDMMTAKLGITNKEYSAYDIQNNLGKNIYQLPNDAEKITALINVADTIRDNPKMDPLTKVNVMVGVLGANQTLLNQLFSLTKWAPKSQTMDIYNTWSYQFIIDNPQLVNRLAEIYVWTDADLKVIENQFWVLVPNTKK